MSTHRLIRRLPDFDLVGRPVGDDEEFLGRNNPEDAGTLEIEYSTDDFFGSTDSSVDLNH